MNQIILYIMAAGVVIGGLDKILGNKFGLGEKFEQGFQYLGPMALSMVGIICLAPVLASG
ncbi:MAG: ethanolamine utilization protein EutH, partial [Lachnospiraceae bacterium]|nr:ethanolamine utilization protein EutH [Lachnospiraceae bacterium]